MLNKSKISKITFKEMDRDVYVEMLYPNIQIDVFPHNEPNSTTIYDDSIGFLASTTYGKYVFFDYYVSTTTYKHNDERIKEQLKINVKKMVMKKI